ncbi:MAG: extracellular solute-binding protein [Desulfobacterales bacterium]|nr:extracellular solute-binding protein [Desulfobacterales bacterium]
MTAITVRYSVNGTLFRKACICTAGIVLAVCTSVCAQQTAETVTLRYAIHWTDLHQLEGISADGVKTTRGVLDYLREYERIRPHIKIEHMIIPYVQYPSKLKLFHEVGKVPDIYQIYASWGVSFVQQGIFDPAPADLVADIQSHFLTTAGVTINGSIWGIPTEINDYALLCNKKIFRESGLVDDEGNIKYPRTWEELLDAAARTTKLDADGKMVQCGFAFFKGMDFGVVDPFLSLLFTNNGRFLSEDNKTFLANSPEGVQTLEAMKALFKIGAADLSFNMWDFGKETVAMVIAAPWTESHFRGAFRKKLDNIDFNDRVGVVPIPYLKKRANLQYSWFMGVMAQSPHKKEAWDFLRWFAGEIQPETGRTRYGALLADTIGAIPARTSDIKRSPGLNNPFKKVYVDQLANSVPEPSVAEYSRIKNILRIYIESALAGEISSQKALGRAAVEINEILHMHYR